MPLLFKKGDITKLSVDAIVNAANNSLLGGGGVDGCIHRAAGPALLRECETLGGCATGDAKITKGYNLPAKYVIHTVGPVWCGGNHREHDLLVSCYRKSLELAVQNSCNTVAFPVISAGAYGYPKKEAVNVAVETINDFLYESGSDLTVYIVFYDNSNPVSRRRVDCLNALWPELLENVDRYISQTSLLVEPSGYTRIEETLDDNDSVVYEDIKKEKSTDGVQEAKNDRSSSLKIPVFREIFFSRDVHCNKLPSAKESVPFSEYINKHEDSFSEKLLKFIEASGLTNSKCYNQANVSKQVFSKIISDENYTPKKPVALAFAIALKLSVSETDDLLKSAGMALSGCNRFDLIVQYFIETKEYDIFKINEILMEYGEPQLGSSVK